MGATPEGSRRHGQSQNVTLRVDPKGQGSRRKPTAMMTCSNPAALCRQFSDEPDMSRETGEK